MFSSCEDSEPAEAPVISKITNTAVELSDGTKIDLPADASSGVSTVFVVPPGEYNDEGTSRMLMDLSDNGVQYAEKLRDLFKNVNMECAMGPGTNYINQTGKIVMEPYGKKMYSYNNVDYGSLLSYIYELKKGEKFLVVEIPAKIQELLYTLTADSNQEVYEDEVYDDMFILKTSKRGEAEVRKVKF